MLLLAKPRLFLALVIYAFIGAAGVAADHLRFSSNQPEIHAHPDLFGQIDSLTSDSAERSAALTAAYPTSINITSGNFTLSGAPGETVVLNLKNFVLGGTATFTLEGTATTQFVINVRKRFALSGNSAIVLGDGVDLTNVHFNIAGKGEATLRGNSVFRGIITAPSRTVSLSQNALVYGRVTAHKALVSGNARIIPPPVVSP